jgi:L-iditol 2-dehydrogenase
MTDTGLVCFAPDKYSVELREIPRAAIDDDQVLLEVAAVGVCGSDLHMWTAEQSWPVRYPVVLGHEFCGVVREVGGRVAGWRVGDRVVSETHAEYDAMGPLSRVGFYNLDPSRRGYGAVIDGAMRRFVAVPARILHRMPNDLTFEKGALTEPCCVAYSAVVVHGRIKPGDRIVVLGPGPIGVLCAAMARLQGAEVAVVGLERDRARLVIAEQYGCAPLVTNEDAWAREVDGLGADGVIDAAGVSATLKTAIDIVRPCGWISKVGWGPQPLEFSLDALVQKNVSLQGSFSHNWPIWERVIRLLATGQLDVEPIIGGVWPLEKWREAFESMHSGVICKAVLEPS